MLGLSYLAVGHLCINVSLCGLHITSCDIYIIHSPPPQVDHHDHDDDRGGDGRTDRYGACGFGFGGFDYGVFGCRGFVKVISWILSIGRALGSIDFAEEASRRSFLPLLTDFNRIKSRPRMWKLSYFKFLDRNLTKCELCGFFSP